MPDSSERPYKHILVCRTDAVGDVILVMPLCGMIKKYYPDAKVSLLGRTYTKPVAACCIHIDGFVNMDDWNGKSDAEIAEILNDLSIDTVLLLPAYKRLAYIMKFAGIKFRVGTATRWFHWLYCNRLVWLSRKNSPLHEAQLHFKLLKGIGINESPSKEELFQYYGLSNIEQLEDRYKELLSESKFNLVLHPKSGQNAPEWSLDHYSAFIELADKNKFNILISGSVKEKDELASWLKKHKNQVTDITGIFSLSQFIAFVSNCDGLLACSTGPVHIAAATGIHAMGLYPTEPFRNAIRWAPIGAKAEHISSSGSNLSDIEPQLVYSKIRSWEK
ncbi:glycosyl transferase family 9 [Pedobacter sp. HMF7647]|uniref:Glycosyl transferase family 9 n=1 Tax=Hufsiella arboris TaxID=2695275 RepID=A0A7K1Y7H3_9SPHI|nr:glycosyltransferase family 9 protein [Hufsiella arboris]MXV50018.1 glycosyl transferase family 9 [Hufsiella arboris]